MSPHPNHLFLEAIRRRDPAYDGAFVFAVATTGIYCKPSCPSRPARPDNISLHATPADAEKAGFRPCKRCRPNEVAGAHPHAAAVARACALIRSSEETPKLETLAAASGLSPFHFHRVFRALTGVTPKNFAAAEKSRRAQAALRSAATVTEAIYGSGFSSASRFYETSNARLGMTPKALRAGGKGATIRFAVGQTSLGAILVAATEKGICAISLGDDPEQLLRDLQKAFPNANLLGAEPDFERTVARVVGLVEAPGQTLDLPMDIRGTAFQQRVWAALLAIPPGTTSSYAQIAGVIGRPGAARAVAKACAGNTLAVAIPCHRVIRTDGGLSGYRWGIDRKRELLNREGA
jgi:AraC family transcriptional regulator of adaptative response/methylated-DNA-[protein]-cysteine methyltransferase